MTTYLPTLVVENVTIKATGIEFKGDVCVFYAGEDYVWPMNFVGYMTKTISATPTPVFGEWSKGPVFNKLKRLSFSDKEFLGKAKIVVRKHRLPMGEKADDARAEQPTE
jgi:hypothetical protein